MKSYFEATKPDKTCVLGWRNLQSKMSESVRFQGMICEARKLA